MKKTAEDLAIKYAEELGLQKGTHSYVNAIRDFLWGYNTAKAAGGSVALPCLTAKNGDANIPNNQKMLGTLRIWWDIRAFAMDGQVDFDTPVFNSRQEAELWLAENVNKEEHDHLHFEIQKCYST